MFILLVISKTTCICSLCHALCCRVCFKICQQNTHECFEINAIQDDGCSVEEVVPNFWPLQIYNDNFPEEAHIDSVKTRKYKGKEVKGVYVPDDGRPLPVGVLKFRNYVRKYTRREKD